MPVAVSLLGWSATFFLSQLLKDQKVCHRIVFLLLDTFHLPSQRPEVLSLRVKPHLKGILQLSAYILSCIIKISLVFIHINDLCKADCLQRSVMCGWPSTTNKMPGKQPQQTVFLKSASSFHGKMKILSRRLLFMCKKD